MADRLTNSSPGPKSRKRSRQPSTEEAATTAADAENPPPNPSTLTPGRKDDASSLLQDAGDRQNCSRQPKCRRLSPSTEEQTISVLPASSLGSLLDSRLSSASSCPSSSSSCPSSSSSCFEPIFEDFVVTCTSADQQSLPFNRKRGLKRQMTSARTSTAADAENPPTQGEKDEASSLPQDAGDHQSCSRQPKCRRLSPSMEEQTISVLPPSSLSPSSLGSLLEDPPSSASSCPSSSSCCPSSSFSCPYPSFSCPSPSSCPFPSFCCPSSYFSYLCPSLSCPSPPPFSSTSTEEPEMIVIVSDDEDDDDSENYPIWEQLNTQQTSFDLSIDLQNEIPEPQDLGDVHDLREPNEVCPQPTSNPRMLTVETGHFPTKIFTSATHNHQTKCCVCTEEYMEGEELRVLPCFHAYHVKCIDTWLKVKKICPLCRLQLH